MKNNFRYLLIVAAFLITSAAAAQDEARKGRPDIPGVFSVEYGLNITSDSPDNFDLNTWGSQTVNVYYQYEFQLFDSKFSLLPGIGLGLEHYKFNNIYTLAYQSTTDGDVLQLVPGPAGTKKSQLITNYIDIPVELIFRTIPNDPARSFRASLGFRVGVLYDSFTKIKYEVNGDKHKIKDKQNFELNNFRYGPFFKVGVGNFSIFYYSNISSFFKEGKTPGQPLRDMTSSTIGFSIIGF